MSITCVTFERTQSFFHWMHFWEKTGSHRLVRCAFGDCRQPLRRRMLYFERRQSFVASHVVLEKAGSHNTTVGRFREEERTSNSSSEFWKCTQ